MLPEHWSGLFYISQIPCVKSGALTEILAAWILCTIRYGNIRSHIGPPISNDHSGRVITCVGVWSLKLPSHYLHCVIFFSIKYIVLDNGWVIVSMSSAPLFVPSPAASNNDDFKHYLDAQALTIALWLRLCTPNSVPIWDGCAQEESKVGKDGGYGQQVDCILAEMELLR